MANDLSTMELDAEICELSNELSSSEWNDEVKDSYYQFVNEENNLVSNIRWLTSKANGIFNHVTSVDPAKFVATYNECLSKLNSLQRGG